MITFVDLDDPSYSAAVTLGTLKKSELRFGTNGASDLITITEAPLPITSIPAVSTEMYYPIRNQITSLPIDTKNPINNLITVVENNISGSTPAPSNSIDTSKRKIYDGMFYTSLPKSDLIPIVEEPLIGSFGGGCMGFCTDNVSTRGWIEERTYDKSSSLYFNTVDYDDRITILENVLSNPALSAAVTVAKPMYNNIYDCLFFFTNSYDDRRIVTENSLSLTLAAAPTKIKQTYFDGNINFTTTSPINMNGITNIVDPPDAITGTFGNLSNCRSVPLSGSVVGTSDYFLVVLNKNNDRIIHLGNLTPGAWEQDVITEDDTVTVIGIAKTAGKKSFAYKSIDIAGVSG